MNTPPPPSTPPAPPFGQARNPGPAKWPKTLGIIAIIFGAGGLLMGLFAPTSAYILRAQTAAILEGDESADLEAYLARSTSIGYQSAAIYGVAGALLLAGGILLLRRRRVASPVLKFWAVLKLAGGTYLVYQNTILTKIQFAALFRPEISMPEVDGSNEILEDFDRIMDTTSGIMQAVVWFGAVFGWLWLAALPVFLLIWLNRSRVKAEIASW